MTSLALVSGDPTLGTGSAPESSQSAKPRDGVVEGRQRPALARDYAPVDGAGVKHD